MINEVFDSLRKCGGFFMEMTHRERILNALRGKEVDRIPWSPFLAYYWENLPMEVQNRGQITYMLEMGSDPLLRGFLQLFDTKINNCNIIEKQNGNKKYMTYETKVGSITKEYSFSLNANSWFLTGHPVKEEEDFKVLQYITENTVVTENLQQFEEENKALGENGLHLPLLGVHGKTAFQSMVEHWCGTVDLVYALYDFPEAVEECLAVIQEKDLEAVKISAKSSADGFIFWEDSSTTNISPDFFSKYTAPEINQWGNVIHNHEKLLVHHACGHLKDLLHLMAKTEIDVIESISPPPTGNIEIKDAIKLLPDHIGIIGGIEPTFIENCNLEMLEACVCDLASTMKGKRFILANSDSCPPNVAYEKFLLVSELVRKLK